MASQRSVPELPPQVARHVRALEVALARKIAGKDATKQIADAIAASVRAADALARLDESFTTFSATMPQVIGQRIRGLRQDAGYTQAQLAEAMTRVGFRWQRMTVTEVEKDTE